MKDIADAVAAARKSRKMSQVELAVAAGLSLSLVSKFETQAPDATKDPKKIAVMCRAVGVPYREAGNTLVSRIEGDPRIAMKERVTRIIAELQVVLTELEFADLSTPNVTASDVPPQTGGGTSENTHSRSPQGDRWSTSRDSGGEKKKPRPRRR